MNQTDTVVRCDDGTEVPFEWAYEGAEAKEWVRDRAHWPDPAVPMDKWIRQHSWAGADRAWAEAGLTPLPVFKRFQMVGPYLYVSVPSPEEMIRVGEQNKPVLAKFGSPLRFWQEYAEPRIKQVCQDVAAMGADTPLEVAAELSGYGFHQTFTSLSSLITANMQLTILLASVAGPDAMLQMYEVTQGGENKSQAIDAEIRDLAELARKTPAAARILAEHAPAAALSAMRADADASPFVAAFDALIKRHATRSLGWDVSLPTWGEQPEAALALVCAQLESNGPTLAEVHAGSERRRREATGRALAALPPDKHDEFRAHVATMDGYVSIREGRAYWQMLLTGELRALVLRAGAELAREGRIDAAADVLFLTPEDYRGSTGDLRALVAQRRADWERFRVLEPPASIGTPQPAMMPPAPEPGPGELRGQPASRGTVTGRARTLNTPDELASLEPGDILVCVRTTPSWTPLFAVIAGIVTETGGALSHPAITAREYGIPAVLAVKDAMKLIRDGQMISIDGGAGTVALHA